MDREWRNKNEAVRLGEECSYSMKDRLTISGNLVTDLWYLLLFPV